MAVSVPFPSAPRGEASKGVAAVVGSLAVNLGGMYLAGLFLAGGGPGIHALPEVPVNEVVISLEELIPQVLPSPPEPAKAPDSKAYVNTFANQEAERAPRDARFESDRNTVAMTEKAAADPGAEALPTQDGEKKIPFMQLQEHRYKDGPDGEIPRTPQVDPGVPVMPSALPKLPGEEIKQPEPAPQLPREPNTSENREREPEKAERSAKELAQAKTQEGEPGVEQRQEKPGERGGARETLEMAQVDVAQMTAILGDKVLDETALVKAGPKDAMPERSPDLEDPANPLLKAPAPAQAPSAPLRAQPIARSPQDAMAPLPPGAMAAEPTNGMADAAAFSPEHHRNQIKGSLSNVGRTSAVDAEATPLGQYKKLVNRAIERRWHQLRIENESFLSFGSLRIRFEVRKDGRVRGVRVLHEDANAVMTSFSLQAINTAKIPPMPEEIINLIGDEGLQATYDIIIY